MMFQIKNTVVFMFIGIIFDDYQGIDSYHLNHTSCRGFPFIVESPLCPGNGHLAPVQLIFGDSARGTWHQEVGRGLQGPLRDPVRNGECKINNKDQVQRFCIPFMKGKVPGKYNDLLGQCSRGIKCILGTGNHHVDGSFRSADYMSLEYDCVDDKDTLHVKSNSSLSGEAVYLISEITDGAATGDTCVAHATDCGAGVDVYVVDSVQDKLSPYCKLAFMNETSTFKEIDCAQNTVVTNCNNILYSTDDNHVRMNLTMTFNPDHTQKQFFWMKIKATSGKVTVFCGTKQPAHIAYCTTTSTKTTTTTTTTTATTTTTSTTSTTATTTTTNPPSSSVNEDTTVHLESTSSEIDISETSTQSTGNQTTDGNTIITDPGRDKSYLEEVIGGSIGGGVLIIVVITVTIIVCRRRRRRNRNNSGVTLEYTATESIKLGTHM